MSFTDSEKAFLFSMGVKISDPPVADELGAKSLERLFLSDPGTEIYFYQFNNGGKIMKAIGNAAQNLDNLDDALSPPNDLQPQNFWLNPDNFKMMSNTLNGVLAKEFPSEFNINTQAAWNKFMSVVSSVLESKNR